MNRTQAKALHDIIDKIMEITTEEPDIDYFEDGKDKLRIDLIIWIPK